MDLNYHPIRRCEIKHTMVRTDQTQQECALEHGCPAGRDCPLAVCFAKLYVSYRSPRTWE